MMMRKGYVFPEQTPAPEAAKKVLGYRVKREKE